VNKDCEECGGNRWIEKTPAGNFIRDHRVCDWVWKNHMRMTDDACWHPKGSLIVVSERAEDKL